MSILFDQSDFSVVVKNRAPPPETVEMGDISGWAKEPAGRAGKEALKQLLTQFPA
jgi:hypothetical protein